MDALQELGFGAVLDRTAPSLVHVYDGREWIGGVRATAQGFDVVQRTTALGKAVRTMGLPVVVHGPNLLDVLHEDERTALFYEPPDGTGTVTAYLPDDTVVGMFKPHSQGYAKVLRMWG
jgi:hypothetical protein